MVRSGFESSLCNMHNKLLRMGRIVEKQIFNSIKELENRDLDLAEKVIKNDHIVDDAEKEIEDIAIKLIAMQQPLASDLRNIFTTTKIVTDLERIADHATNICEWTIYLVTGKQVDLNE